MDFKDMTDSMQGRGSLMLEGRGADEKYVLLSFIGKGKGRQLVKICRAHQALGNTIMLGRGTARSEILDYLGLELDEKEIVVSHVQAGRAQQALQALRSGLEMDRPGHGIAFLVPILDSKGLKAIFRLAEQMDEGNAEVEDRADPFGVPDEGIIFGQHDLIVAVLQADITETAIDLAREAGAAGGTILHGQSWNVHEQAGQLDVALEPKKELLLMLVRRSKTQPIIRILHERLSSDGADASLIFALPVSAVTGLSHRLIIGPDGAVAEQTHHV